MMRRTIIHIFLFVAVAVSASAEQAFIPPKKHLRTALVYTGGVAGIETMMDAVASRSFRFKGGGIYLHGVGWKALSDEQRKRVVEAIEGAPVAVELGFGKGEKHDRAWVGRLKGRYRKYGIEPDFILSTAFNKGNVPTVERWDSFVADFREADYKNPIYPIFEYANHRDNINFLTTNKVSQRTDYQTIVKHAGGISIDTAAGYFLEKRDNNYRDWIVDAIKWTKGIGGITIVIASPMNSQDFYKEHVTKFVGYLKSANAMPDTFIIENYEADPQPGYIPVVGREWIEDTCFGVGLYLLTSRLMDNTRVE